MIQAAMIFALGVLVAGLLALLVAPAIWRRAMRLARTRIEAKVPLSRAEIDADKDQLRAGFAVSNRRLEIETTKLRERLAEGEIALGRRNEEAAKLALSNKTLTETAATLETRLAEVSGTLDQTSERLTAVTAELTLRDSRIEDQEAALASVRAELGSAQLMTEELRLEMVARQTEIANLADSLAERSAAELATAAARDQLAQDLNAERERLAAEAARLDGLQASLAALQGERSTLLAEVERLVAELEQRGAEVRTFEAAMETAQVTRQALMADVENVRADRARLAAELAERGQEIARLTAALEDTARHREESGAGMEGASSEIAGDNLRKALSAAEAQNSELGLRLAALEDDLAALRAENADLRRVAGAEWESEREDNRRLRERLNEIAAGVVRLTQTLETNGGEPHEGDAGTRPIPLTSIQRNAPAAPATATGENVDTLADRLRALQHAARH